MPVIEYSDRDWREDWPGENGQYICRCSQCQQTFIGYKRRVICKACAYTGIEAESQALSEERDLLWQTFFNLAEKLGIDPEVEKSAPGKPSDVFLRHIAALRARVVVVPERMPPTVEVAGKLIHTSIAAKWNACLDELARLNGKAVSEGLLRRVIDHLEWDGKPETTAHDYVSRGDKLADELRALLGEGKEVGDVPGA